LINPGEFVPLERYGFFASAFFIEMGGPGLVGPGTGACGWAPVAPDPAVLLVVLLYDLVAFMGLLLYYP